MSSNALILRRLPLSSYEPVFTAMKDFTLARDDSTTDELWVLEHEPVFTQGQSGKPEHILRTTDIPIVQTDRGGQVTYHGPGQLMLYPLINIQRLGLDVKALVCKLEQLVIDILHDYDVQAARKDGAPGVYVDGAKIASIGLRVKKGASYHGVSFNIDMDLAPFKLINPCGYQGLQMTDLARLTGIKDMAQVKEKVLEKFCQAFGYRIMDE